MVIMMFQDQNRDGRIRILQALKTFLRSMNRVSISNIYFLFHKLKPTLELKLELERELEIKLKLGMELKFKTNL